MRHRSRRTVRPRPTVRTGPRLRRDKRGGALALRSPGPLRTRPDGCAPRHGTVRAGRRRAQKRKSALLLLVDVGTIAAMAVLTTRMLRQFRDCGYIVVRGLVPEHLLIDADHEIDDVATGPT